MSTIQLARFARARSGDKGNSATVAVFAPNDELYAALCREVTRERVAAHVGALGDVRVECYPVPNLRAVHLVIRNALGGGAARSLRTDKLGKSLGALLLRLEVGLTDAEERALPPVQRPPR